MLLIDEYIDYCKKYSEIYEKYAVLIQVGDFFELYGIPETNEGVNIKELCDIMEIDRVRKEKVTTTVTKSHPYMAGFPCYILNKYTDILISNNYTVIVIEQVTPPPKPKREVTKILSPSINIENNDINNNFLLCIYFTNISFNQKSFLVGSISYVDVITNQTFIYECVDNDTQINFEEINKLINYTIKPSEIIVFTDLQTKSNEESMKILNEFVKNFPNICVHNKLNSIIDDNYFRISYQKTILEKVFKNIGILNILDYLNLSKNPLSIVSFCYLIQFIYEHSEKILEGIQPPNILNNNKYLQLINNAVENLNIISKDNKAGKTSSVLSLLNNCKTPIGKRFFKYSLLNPLTDIKLLNKRYDMIDFFNNDDLYEDIRTHLGKIYDLEKLFKRIAVKNLHPYQFLSIDSSMKSIKNILEILKKKEFKFIDINWNENSVILENFINYYEIQFNIEKMEKISMNQLSKNFFNEGLYPELDDIEKRIIYYENIFENILDCLNENKEDLLEFKLDINKENVRVISITKNRYTNLLKDKNRCDIINNLLKKYNLNLSDFTPSPLTPNNKTYYKLTYKNMYEDQVKLTNLQQKLKNKIQELYILQLTYLYENYYTFFNDIIHLISHIDFFSCNSYNSNIYFYNKPEIQDTDDSFIEAKSIRHPLIEIIQKDIPYISNDIEIGLSENKGMLLYGINSVGKSSYMKSIGINLILAQSGMFVAAKTFKYSPYDHIFSRMPSGDNLYEGKSTYVCEINELRTILKKSNNKSLVIGDELCSGTEITSAISLIASGINMLSNKNCSFIFASHLHELCDLECIKNIKKLNIYHLSVDFDKEKNCLIYDRKLKKGNGNTLYGLEIAKSLDLPPEFLLFANKIRQEYTDMNKNFLNTKKSTYSSSVYMDKCSICNNECDEVHHITEQQYANKKGIIEDKQIHKNHKSNLLPVCSKCHDNIHNNNIVINGYKQSSDGIILDVKIKKEQDLTYIKEKVLKLRGQGNTYAKILEIITKEHEKEKITLYKIIKWLK